MEEIYCAAVIEDDFGKHWYVINGEVWYGLDDGWTEETAREDYLSAESVIERKMDFMEANGFFD